LYNGCLAGVLYTNDTVLAAKPAGGRFLIAGLARGFVYLFDPRPPPPPTVTRLVQNGRARKLGSCW